MFKYVKIVTAVRYFRRSEQNSSALYEVEMMPFGSVVNLDNEPVSMQFKGRFHRFKKFTWKKQEYFFLSADMRDAYEPYSSHYHSKRKWKI